MEVDPSFHLSSVYLDVKCFMLKNIFRKLKHFLTRRLKMAGNFWMRCMENEQRERVSARMKSSYSKNSLGFLKRKTILRKLKKIFLIKIEKCFWFDRPQLSVVPNIKK
jgi:hypothetical protein